MAKFKFTKKEAADFKIVSRIYRKLDGSAITYGYELGRAVNATMEHAKADRQMYDKQVIENFAVQLDCGSALLYGAARIFRAWSVKSKFDAWVNKEHDDGWKLKWTHFVYLSNNGVARKREALVG